MTSEFNQLHDRWKGVKLKNSDLYIYSAYYDDRRRALSAKEGNDPVVRINVVAPKLFKTNNGNTLCLVKLKNGSVVNVKVSVIQLLEHFNMKWTSYFVNCRLTQIIQGKLHDKNATLINRVNKDDISAVTLFDREHLKDHTNLSDSELLRVHKFDPPTFNQTSHKSATFVPNHFAICIKPIYLHWNRAIWLVEFFEMYRLLGKITHLK